MNKNEIRIGDVLYAPSTMYKKVIEHKDRMILADNTKKLVERFLEEIKMELDKDEHSAL